MTKHRDIRIIAPRPAPLLVGRERERTLLRDRLDAALAGKGGFVLISGEAGIGKTALAELFAGDALEQGARALIGRCHDLTDTPPFGPWYELFQQAARQPDLPPPPTAFAHPRGMGAAPDLAMLVVEAREYLRALAMRYPVLLILEDMHWADAASLDLLRALTPAIVGLPSLILVTYRGDELPADHPRRCGGARPAAVWPAARGLTAARRAAARPRGGEPLLHAGVAAHAGAGAHPHTNRGRLDAR